MAGALSAPPGAVLTGHAAGAVTWLGVSTTAVAWLVGALLAISAALLGYALVHIYTSPPAAGAAGPPSKELLWMVLPLAILAAIFVASLRG
jgi:hypothetical protein